MTTIAVRFTKYVRFTMDRCSSGVKDCDFQGWDPVAEEPCCDRYHDGPEKACPQLRIVGGGSSYVRCRQCLDEFKDGKKDKPHKGKKGVIDDTRP